MRLASSVDRAGCRAKAIAPSCALSTCCECGLMFLWLEVVSLYVSRGSEYY